jgi:EpsI family protein
MGPAFLNRPGAWGPAFLLAIGCGLSLSIDAQRTMELAAPLEQLPTVLEGHQGTDLPIDPEQARIAGASDALLRAYGRDSTPRFSIYVGYYARQRQGKTIHSPKNCLPGAGWEPLESRRETLVGEAGEPIRLNRFVIASKQERAVVYYWYQGRGRTEASEYQVKLDLIRDSALKRRSEEALVRLVVPVARDDAEADELARRVVVRLHAALKGILPA